MIQFKNLLYLNQEDINLLIIISFLTLIYLLIVLTLTYFIYNLLTKKNKINYYRDISIIKDKDFIFFK